MAVAIPLNRHRGCRQIYAVCINLLRRCHLLPQGEKEKPYPASFTRTVSPSASAFRFSVSSASSLSRWRFHMEA
jgi:hypothetical protein